ncbi:MAG: cation:proton antiporter [Bacteroidales bacterium]|nr:cation:proton antiporter [Bacteroidales bacterium]
MNLVRDLAVILISAGLFTIIFRALKQPLVLGYIIAGFLIGPHISFFPGVYSIDSVKQWSEIGIIFLMFALGLEFSFKKLLKVGTAAVTIAGGKFIGVFVLGFAAGQAMNWTFMESIFLAGLLSMSSTTVVIKAFDDLGLKKSSYAGLVFGTLVVEDLIAILLMVLLSTMAVSNSFAGGEMIFNLAKLAFFIILAFLIGIYAIPTLLRRFGKFINNEILLLVSIGLCFGMVTLATSVGFSSALGAFVMGSILAETVESERIVKLTSSIKDLFGAIFFVSVGMMVDPQVIGKYWFIILIITLLVYLTHIVFAGMGVLLSGKGLENAVHTGFSLAQLGEFGFIIAGVGVTLGVMRDFIYPIIIAVSVITTFTTPIMIKLADPAYKFLVAKTPQKLLNFIDPPQKKQKSNDSSEWEILIRMVMVRVTLYGVVLVAILLASKGYLEKFVYTILPTDSEFVHDLVVVGITVVVMMPFLYGFASNPANIKKQARILLKRNPGNSLPLMGIVLLRTFIASSIVLEVVVSHFNLNFWTIVAVFVFLCAFIMFSRHSFHKLNFVEDRFLANLNAKEAQNQEP